MGLLWRRAHDHWRSRAGAVSRSFWQPAAAQRSEDDGTGKRARARLRLGHGQQWARDSDVRVRGRLPSGYMGGRVLGSGSAVVAAASLPAGVRPASSVDFCSRCALFFAVPDKWPSAFLTIRGRSLQPVSTAHHVRARRHCRCPQAGREGIRRPAAHPICSPSATHCWQKPPGRGLLAKATGKKRWPGVIPPRLLRPNQRRTLPVPSWPRRGTAPLQRAPHTHVTTAGAAPGAALPRHGLRYVLVHPPRSPHPSVRCSSGGCVADSLLLQCESV